MKRTYSQATAPSSTLSKADVSHPSTKPASNTLPTPQHKLYKSNPVYDRSSTFVGLFSPTVTAKSLQASLEFRDASHRIAAWRTPSRSQRSVVPSKGGVLETGFDDDGESRAGKVLEKLLVDLGVQGSVVVARWYGGVLLGPVRFKHIEDVAKEAIGKWRDEVKGEIEEKEAKRRRIEEERDEEEQRGRLAKVLVERDASIEVLRHLLKDKTTKVENSYTKDTSETTRPKSTIDGGAATATSLKPRAPVASQSPSKPPLDYNSMPLTRLRILEKARDATIAAILKRLDEIEQQQVNDP